MHDKDEGSGAPIDFDRIVEALIPDPNQLPDATPVIGFVGRSPVKGCVRVYVDRKFNAFIEIQNCDILHQQSLDKLTKGQGGSLVWVRRTAEVTVTRSQSQTIEAEFLRGPVASSQQHGALPSFQAEAVRAAKLKVTDWFCWSGEQWMWCTGAWYKDCTNDTYRRVKKHVTEHVRCKDGCWLTF